MDFGLLTVCRSLIPSVQPVDRRSMVAQQKWKGVKGHRNQRNLAKLPHLEVVGHDNGHPQSMGSRTYSMWKV
jgi:hypothetical protein